MDTEVSSYLHTSMYLAGKEALQLHQNPKEAGAAELAAKAGVGASHKPKGNPFVLAPRAPVQTEPAAHERYWRLPGSQRPLPPR